MKIQKRVAVAAAVFFVAVLAAGCRFKKASFASELGDGDVFRIGDIVCTLPEAKVYLCNYQNIYGTAFTINLWEHETSEHLLEHYVKDITVAELTRIVCMDELAKRQEISLTKEEKMTAKEAAEEYYQSLTEEEISYMDISEGMLAQMYENYALAQKLYASLTEGIDGEVSDDEARIMEAMQIFVTSEERLEEVKKALDAGRDFSAVAADYNEAGRIEITFGRGDLPAEVEAEIFQTEEEEITPCIQTEKGYYYMKCIDKFNQELTDEHKLTIVKQREKEAFDDVYREFIGGLDSVMNDTLWKTVRVETGDNITTDSFFAVYEDKFEN